MRFSLAMLLVCLLLQRFGVSSGTTYLGVVGPLGLVMALAALMRGVLAFETSRLLVFLSLCAWIALATAVRACFSETYAIAQSWPSMAQFLLLTGFATLTFAHPVDEGRFFRMVNKCFAVVAAAAVMQFVAQFAGIRLFSFSGFLPRAILVEFPFNVVIPIGDTPYFKANGFFLLEPSILSQMMALGLLIEVLLFRRVGHLCLFMMALLVSVSGTGWLVIGSFVLTATCSMGTRGIKLALSILALLAAAVGVLAVAMPEIFATFIGRVSEFWTIGSSGHERFVTPGWLMYDVLSRTPWIALFGLGAGVSERVSMPYEFAVNTPVKIFLEYGLPALVAYLLLLLLGSKRPVQAALIVPYLTLILFAGGNMQAPFILFPAMLLIPVANLRSYGTSL